MFSDLFNLKRNGESYNMYCPFCSSKSRHFVITSHKKKWKCFSCGRGGHLATSFIQQYKKLSFIDSFYFCLKYYKGNAKLKVITGIRGEASEDLPF